MYWCVREPRRRNKKVIRTNIEVDEAAIAEIIRIGEAKNQRQAIENAMQKYLRFLAKLDLLELKGKVKWEGNLDEMRSI